jgi:chromosome partitioning protein
MKFGFASSAAPAPAAAPAARQAHRIVVGNEKGGAGKSTVAMHLAVALLRMNKRVGLIDLDVRQRSLTRYVENRRASVRGGRTSLPMPEVIELRASLLKERGAAEAEESAMLAHALGSLAGRCDYVVVDAPGADTHYSRTAHGGADTLITPLNDSFIDFDLLGDVDAATMEVVRPSIYSEMVWNSRKRKAHAREGQIDWVVMRNRVSTSRIEAKNKQRVGDALHALSNRIGFRVAPGLSERVVFRELFPQGLTLLDVIAEADDAQPLKMAHLAARQELRDFLIVLKLPGLEGAALTF